jgi:hypothetical protein
MNHAYKVAPPRWTQIVFALMAGATVLMLFAAEVLR